MADRRPPAAPPPRRRRRRFVGTMRLVLPGIAIGLIVLVVAWPKIFGDVAGTIAPGGLLNGFSITEPMRMRHPRYVGADGNGGQPYEVVADQALVDPRNPDRITLQDMRATTKAENGGLTTLDSENALYQRGIGRLDLDGDVRLTTADRTVFTTDKATVLLNERRAFGNDPVHGVGPLGTLDAQAFEIERGGDVANFHGKVRVVIRPAGNGDKP